MGHGVGGLGYGQIERFIIVTCKEEDNEVALRFSGRGPVDIDGRPKPEKLYELSLHANAIELLVAD